MNMLDNHELVSRLDRADMLGFISGLPDQCQGAYGIGKNLELSMPDRRIDNIVFTGLGGSAIGADIVRVYLRNELKIPMVLSRNYSLPDFVGENTLLFCSSYSGNTEETLSSFADGMERGAFIVTMGSGGRLKELSEKKGFEHVTVPSGFPPRTALGYMSITVLAILNKMGFIEDKGADIARVRSTLIGLRDKEAGLDVVSEKNISKRLAARLCGKYCIIYGTSDSTEAVAVRWRAQLAENSKSLASSHMLPEMNHNEIVGWEFPKKTLRELKVLMLYDEDDHPRTKKRIEVSSEIIKESGAEIFELKRDAGSLLERVFSLIYIGDFVSFYLAMLNGVDPTPVKGVDYLKTQLANM